MTLFESFMIAHLIGDYLLQTLEEANQKAQKSFFNWPLWRHVIKYTAVCAVPIWYFSAHPAWILLVFGSHLLFDRRWPIIWWRHHVTRNSMESIEKTWWLTVVIDQIFHILVLALIAALS